MRTFGRRLARAESPDRGSLFIGFDAGMDLEITFDDPKYYTRPFGFTTTLTMIPGSDVLAYVRTENEKDSGR